jgi:hypothetical protein
MVGAFTLVHSCIHVCMRLVLSARSAGYQPDSIHLAAFTIVHSCMDVCGWSSVRTVLAASLIQYILRRMSWVFRVFVCGRVSLYAVGLGR